MTNEQSQVKLWMQSFCQATPDHPTIPSLEVRRLRAKIILEEALETIKALGIRVHAHFDDNTHCRMDDFIDEFNFGESGEEPNLELIADGCEDLKVVTEGTLVACGLCQSKPPENVVGEIYKRADNDPLFDEVMRSNWSKMWNLLEIAESFGDPLNHKRTLMSSDKVLYETKDGFFIQEISENRWLVKDSSGKVIKSPSYSSANLQPIIDKL